MTAILNQKGQGRRRAAFLFAALDFGRYWPIRASRLLSYPL
jgi:hypothetical protein